MCPTGTGLAEEILRRESKSNLRSAFDVLDVDHDGKISTADLRAFYDGYLAGAAAGTSDINEEDDIIESMISVADSNRDGFVEYDEFQSVLEGSAARNDDVEKSNNGGKLRKWSLMEDVFKAMDRDGDGKVGHGDLKEFLNWAGLDDVSDDDVKAMIKLGGGDDHENGGGVSYDSLLKILAI